MKTNYRANEQVEVLTGDGITWEPAKIICFDGKFPGSRAPGYVVEFPDGVRASFNMDQIKPLRKTLDPSWPAH